MKRSIIFAVLLAIGATVWVASGQFGESGAEPQAQKPPADLTALEQAPLVRVRPSRAEQHAVIDLLRGRTEANRLVETARLDGKASKPAARRTSATSSKSTQSAGKPATRTRARKTEQNEV
jgi:hypothetical protein